MPEGDWIEKYEGNRDSWVRNIPELEKRSWNFWHIRGKVKIVVKRKTWSELKKYCKTLSTAGPPLATYFPNLSVDTVLVCQTSPSHWLVNITFLPRLFWASSFSSFWWNPCPNFYRLALFRHSLYSQSVHNINVPLSSGKQEEVSSKIHFYVFNFRSITFIDLS